MATAALDGYGPHKEEQSNRTEALATLGNQDAGDKNIAVRFLLAVKGVLLSSLINILLVFVPVGIVARKLDHPL